MIILGSFGKATAQNYWIIIRTKIIENLEVPIYAQYKDTWNIRKYIFY